MDFDEFVWRYRKTLLEISEETGIHALTLSNIKRFKSSPKLETALILYEYCEGKVKLEEMLPSKQRDRVEKFIQEKRDKHLNQAKMMLSEAKRILEEQKELVK